MNIFSEELKEVYQPIGLRGCKEIKFSHGGHLFACASNPNLIHIYNFYTMECPDYYICSGHHSSVRGIDWHEDD